MNIERRATQQESTAFPGQAEQILAALPDALVAIDNKGIIQYCNQRALNILGLECLPQPRAKLQDLLTPMLVPAVDAAKSISRLIDYSSECRLPMQVEGGGTVLRLSVNRLLDEEAEQQGLVISLNAEDSLNEEHFGSADEDLERDSLTGLLNRLGSAKHLDALIADAMGSTRTHAFLMLDLDQFKVINDLSSHVAGDVLLQQVGDALSSSIHPGDLVARLGGDEFGILLSNVECNEAVAVGQRLLSTIQAMRFSWSERSFPISASIGVVPINERTLHAKQILAQADNALYAAKEAGRNRLHIYKPGDKDMVRRNTEMEWIGKINEAFDADHFRLMAQPITKANGQEDGEHFEVLIRMEQDGQLITPGEFLPAAERYGLMDRVDSWVVRSLLDYLEQNPARAENITLCAINLSGPSLVNASFLAYLKEQLSRPHVEPGKLCLEITETAAIQNLAHASRFIEEIHALGCKFSLDDFGSGMSSFGYLRQLPVDYLKIDGVFVRDIDTDPVHQSMVKAINDIGHTMGKKTIAEFVTNARVMSLLQDMEVDYLQGFYISEPQLLRH